MSIRTYLSTLFRNTHNSAKDEKECGPARIRGPLPDYLTALYRRSFRTAGDFAGRWLEL
ncbi:MAG: hypothetical protein P8Y72_03935 [Anaerolineales bacterium]